MNPYKAVGPKALWRRAVSDNNFFNIDEIWTPKFSINKTHKVATYGSCFAQHIARNLREAGYSWVNEEPAPKGLSNRSKMQFNYDIYSSRSGNIYTTSF